MNWIRRLFNWLFHRPKLTERYILNNMYRNDTELVKFVQERIQILKTNSVLFVITWDKFPANQYGKVELVRNNEVIDTAKLMRKENNLIYWSFDE